METLIKKYNSQIVDRQILMNNKDLLLSLVVVSSLKNEISLITNFVKDLEALTKNEYLFYVSNSSKEKFEKYDLVLVTEDQKGTEPIPEPYYAIINKIVSSTKLSITVGGKTWGVNRWNCKHKELIVCKNEGVYRHSDSVGYCPRQQCIIGWSAFDTGLNSELKKIVGIYPKSSTGYPMICKSFAEEWGVRQFDKKELTDADLYEFIIKQNN